MQVSVKPRLASILGSNENSWRGTLGVRTGSCTYTPHIPESPESPTVLALAERGERALIPVCYGGHSPAICRTLAKKARLRGVLIPHSTGGDW